MSNWLAGEIEENKHWTQTLYSLKIRVPDYPSFISGQFTRVALDINGERVARPYSLVNAPHEEFLEVYSILVNDGLLSPALHKLKRGDKIWVSDLVSGFLILNEVPKEHKNLWLMATGTGLGPFLSILKTEDPWRRFENLVLVHAVRYPEELTYGETIRNLTKSHSNLTPNLTPNFTYVPFVSRTQTDFAMDGRIPAALADGSLADRVGLAMRPEDTHIMLCGNPAMLNDVREVMAEKGFKRNRRRDPGHITTENYW